LARQIVDTLREARECAQDELVTRFGNWSAALWFAPRPDQAAGDPEPVTEGELPELVRLRKLAMAKFETGLELHQEAAEAAMVVESSDGQLRILIGAAEVKDVFIDDSLLDHDLLSDLIVKLIQAGMAQSAQRGAERASEMKALDVRAMVAAYAPKENIRG
jgi:DNA-binding protein YbaB